MAESIRITDLRQPELTEYLRTMLKMLQWVRGPRQWVLETPQHLEQIPTLLKVFPDARVVMTPA